MTPTLDEPRRRILIVDDDPTVRQVTSLYLTGDGCQVREMSDAVDMLEVVESWHPDLVVLDVMMPSGSGFDVMRELRRSSSVPVIYLSACVDERDRIRGLELGADDYVTKPFSARELVARVNCVLRRGAGRAGSPTDDDRSPEPLRFGDLSIDESSREVRLNDTVVALTAKEFDLVAFIARHPRRVFSRAELLTEVWQSDIAYQDPATVTVHVRRIRQKIESSPDAPRWFVTVYGIGYRFEP